MDSQPLFSIYNVRHHPKYQNGEWTEKQCFDEFLKHFEPDESRRDGEVSYLINFVFILSAICPVTKAEECVLKLFLWLIYCNLDQLQGGMEIEATYKFALTKLSVMQEYEK